MEKSKYDRATLFLEYIKHINELSEFIGNAKEKKLGLGLHEHGFLSNPKMINLTETDLDMLLRTLEKEKKELEEAFEAL